MSAAATKSLENVNDKTLAESYSGLTARLQEAYDRKDSAEAQVIAAARRFVIDEMDRRFGEDAAFDLMEKLEADYLATC